jgi:hypothetical protein
MDKNLLTRHAVVQFALYACSPFHDVPPAGDVISSKQEWDIVDEWPEKNGTPRQKRYRCCLVISLVEALATALMHYESRCESIYGWPKFQEQQNTTIASLKMVQDFIGALRRRSVKLKDPAFKHRRKLEDPIERTIGIIKGITYQDYQRAGAATDTPGDPRAHGNKYILLNEMKESFSACMPDKWPQAATYRALATIVNQMKITNADGKVWSPDAIKRFLARGPDPRLRVTITLTSPNSKPWYTRPQ